MADKTEFLQAIDDAILDADSLEQFINGSDSETVLTRLSAEYPTLQKAIKQMFENGGLPATPFQTKALMEASALIEGDYAVVTDDAKYSGLYLKTSDGWQLQDIFSTSKNLPKTRAESYGTSFAHVGSLSVPTVQSNSANPSSFFGSRLLNYSDCFCDHLNVNNVVASGSLLAKIIGTGIYPVVYLDKPTNASGFIYQGKWKFRVLSGPNESKIGRSYDPKLAAKATSAASFTIWFAGFPSFLIYSDDRFTLLFETDSLRLITYREVGSINPAGSIELQERDTIDSEWTSIAKWQIDFELEHNESSDRMLQFGDNKITTLAFEFSNDNKQASLMFNNHIVPAVYHRIVKKYPVSSTFKQAELYLKSTTTGYHTYQVASAVLIDTPIEACSKLGSYLTRERYPWSHYYGDKEVRVDELNHRVVPNLLPTPSTLLGGYSLNSASFINQDFTQAEKVLGNAPEFTIPSQPNTAPWDVPSDRMLIDDSVTRIAVMPHPEHPNDPEKLVMMANSISYLTGPLINMCAYESFDGGLSFQRKELENPSVSIPSDFTSSTVNNIVVANQYGRYFYFGDAFPDGYKPETMDKSYKYFFLSETNYCIYGCPDLFDYSTYEKIKFNKQSIPHPSNFNRTTPVYKQNYEGQLALPEGCEEKVLGYDKMSARFFRVLKVNMLPADYVSADESSRFRFLTRNLAITWSEKNDITRWGPYEMMLPARAEHYQPYDLDIIQIRPDYWVVMVFRYTLFYTDRDIKETEYQDQHDKMSVDLYLSRDQLKTYPELIREDWISNKQQEWASGTLWAFGHPYDKNMIYVNGAYGLHGGIRPGESYKDYEWKVATVPYDFPSNMTPDTMKINGLLRSRFFDGGLVDKVRLIGNGSYVKARVLDMDGVVISGMDFQNCMIDEKSQLLHWDGVLKMPDCTVQIEVFAIDYNFGGIYPMQEYYNLLN